MSLFSWEITIFIVISQNDDLKIKRIIKWLIQQIYWIELWKNPHCHNFTPYILLRIFKIKIL
jgi:hypothetical protein